VSSVYDESLTIERPSAPCPHCGYDPYEPFAQQRWQEREEGRRLEVAIAVLTNAGLMQPGMTFGEVVSAQPDEVRSALEAAGVVDAHGNVDPRRWEKRREES
jgi:hypothetical protein